MESLVGFLVALMIGLTGVGGGTLTVPILVLFLGVPVAEAVGTALIFSALVKLPASVAYSRLKQVDYSVLLFMLLGGLPGVVLGSLILGRLSQAGLKSLVLTVVGLTIALIAAANLLRLALGGGRPAVEKHRSHLLPWLTFPIGLEVGFSSAGAGALGTLALFHLTSLAPAQVVGTDLVFGLAVSSVAGALHLSVGNFRPALLLALVAGGMPGAIVGARLTTLVPGRALRIALFAWLVYLGLHLCYRGIYPGQFGGPS